MHGGGRDTPWGPHKKANPVFRVFVLLAVLTLLSGGWLLYRGLNDSDSPDLTPTIADGEDDPELHALTEKAKEHLNVDDKDKTEEEEEAEKENEGPPTADPDPNNEEENTEEENIEENENGAQAPVAHGVVTTEPTIPIVPQAPRTPIPKWTHPIPRIMHLIHKDYDSVLTQDKLLRDVCKAMHPGWKFEFWDDARIEKLIKDEYAWYYPTWKSYTPFIKRVDTSRYILMHARGGVYLDADVECVKSLEDMIEPLPGGAYTGAFPEPMFLMSSPKAKFWLHMLQEINNTRTQDTWANTGPVGLNTAMSSYVTKHGTGVINTWSKKEWVKTNDPVCDNGKFTPWYYYNDYRPASFAPSPGPIADDMKIGFVCNELLDPPACQHHLLAECIDDLCARKWPDSFTVHHCRSTWRPQVGARP